MPNLGGVIEARHCICRTFYSKVGQRQNGAVTVHMRSTLAGVDEFRSSVSHLSISTWKDV